MLFKTAPKLFRRLLLFALVFLVLNYTIDVALFPWYYNLPDTVSAEGRWRAEVPLDTGETVETIMDLYHQPARFTNPGEMNALDGDLEICRAGKREEFAGVLIAVQPAMSWKGHNFVLAFREGVESKAWPWNFVCQHGGDKLVCQLGDSGKSLTMRKLGEGQSLACETSAK